MSPRHFVILSLCHPVILSSCHLVILSSQAMNIHDDPIYKRIRDAVLRLSHAPKRVIEPVDEAETKARAAVRQLARSRVSALLGQLRATHGMTYADVQEKTGLSQQFLFDVEYKERRLTLDELRLLAHCYEVGVNDVLGIELE